MTDANILILGESGTGKEVIANAIHYKSYRSKKPFVKVNCSALPKDLIESQLFGHIKGSFTGANADKIGFIGQANGGQNAWRSRHEAVRRDGQHVRQLRSWIGRGCCLPPCLPIEKAIPAQ